MDSLQITKDCSEIDQIRNFKILIQSENIEKFISQ